MENNSVPPVALRVKQSIVGATEGRVEILVYLRFGDTKADSELWQPPHSDSGVGLGSHTVEHLCRVGRRAVRKYQCELLAAIARDNIAGSECIVKDSCEKAKRPISSVVPVSVVERFEVIKVRHRNGKWVEMRRNRGDPLRKCPPVEQTGQCVR